MFYISLSARKKVVHYRHLPLNVAKSVCVCLSVCMYMDIALCVYLLHVLLSVAYQQDASQQNQLHLLPIFSSYQTR